MSHLVQEGSAHEPLKADRAHVSPVLLPATPEGLLLVRLFHVAAVVPVHHYWTVVAEDSVLIDAIGVGLGLG